MQSAEHGQLAARVTSRRPDNTAYLLPLPTGAIIRLICF